MAADALSDVLRTVRLTGATFFDVAMTVTDVSGRETSFDIEVAETTRRIQHLVWSPPDPFNFVQNLEFEKNRWRDKPCLPASEPKRLGTEHLRSALRQPEQNVGVENEVLLRVFHFKELFP